MSRTFLDWNGDPNCPAQYLHEDGEGNWAIESVQDMTSILETNHFIRENCDVYSPDKDIRMDARIPYDVIKIWQNLYGVDYYRMSDPDQQKFIDRILSSNEWYKIRTSGGAL